LGKWEDQLKQRTIPLSTIKWVSETAVGPESIGFTFKDFDALYGEKFMFMDGGERILNHIKDMMDTPFKDLSEEHKEMLDKIGINAWDLIQSNSGGHKCITNISGLNYLGRSKRPPQGQYRYDSEKDDSPSVKFTKMIAHEFQKKLKEKIEENKSSVNESKNYFKGSHFGDEEGNEFSVEKVYDFVKKNKEKYFHPKFPISKIEHNIEWWNKNYDIKNKEHKERMMNSDTSYPLLVVVEKGNNLSVADGLNRLYKAIKVEKKKTLPIYLVTKKEIENLKEKSSESK
jgi:disulfide oxidoreductase YuzD